MPTDIACVLWSCDVSYLFVSVFVAVGLDAAGKTTILYKLKLGEIVTTIPTIGKLSDGCLLITRLVEVRPTMQAHKHINCI